MAQPNIARLQHLSLEVSDTDRSVAFYRDIFGMKLTERHPAHEVPAIPIELTFLRIGVQHHDLVLVHNPDKTYRPRPTRPEDDLDGSPSFHHFAFECDSQEDWQAVVDRLHEKEVPIVRGPVVHSAYDPRGDGSWGENEAIYCLDPDGHRIEIFWALATVDADGQQINHEGQIVPGVTTAEI